MRDEIVRRGDGLALRIGIDVGPVVAGVIGRSKFSYDLWGDTVNTASRMESHGVPGAIHVTERARRTLGSRYAFEERGVIDVKGKGSMRTFLLLGRAERTAAGAATAGLDR
jgi:guanylate cyclase